MNSVILRGMFRLTVIILGVVWASLLLISWNSPETTIPTTADRGVADTRQS